MANGLETVGDQLRHWHIYQETRRVKYLSESKCLLEEVKEMIGGTS